jgi:hypothetical protein
MQHATFERAMVVGDQDGASKTASVLKPSSCQLELALLCSKNPENHGSRLKSDLEASWVLTNRPHAGLLIVIFPAVLRTDLRYALWT